jgi:hypothetical protein
MAERGVGGDAGIAVRPAALQADHQMRHRAGWRCHGIGDLGHLAQHLQPRSMVRRVPPVCWIVM